MSTLNNFMAGGIMMAYFVSGLFFTRFWARTRDRLFSVFAIAFFMFAVERFIMQITNIQDETQSWLYLIRLAAFMLIIGGVIDKNRHP